MGIYSILSNSSLDFQKMMVFILRKLFCKLLKASSSQFSPSNSNSPSMSYSSSFSTLSQSSYQGYSTSCFISITLFDCCLLIFISISACFVCFALRFALSIRLLMMQSNQLISPTALSSNFFNTFILSSGIFLADTIRQCDFDNIFLHFQLSSYSFVRFFYYYSLRFKRQSCCYCIIRYARAQIVLFITFTQAYEIFFFGGYDGIFYYYFQGEGGGRGFFLCFFCTFLAILAFSTAFLFPSFTACAYCFVNSAFACFSYSFKACSYAFWLCQSEQGLYYLYTQHYFCGQVNRPVKQLPPFELSDDDSNIINQFLYVCITESLLE